jgi:hypothetical protein
MMYMMVRVTYMGRSLVRGSDGCWLDSSCLLRLCSPAESPTHRAVNVLKGEILFLLKSNLHLSTFKEIWLVEMCLLTDIILTSGSAGWCEGKFSRCCARQPTYFCFSEAIFPDMELFFKSLKVLLHARLTPDRRRLVQDFRASTSRV